MNIAEEGFVLVKLNKLSEPSLNEHELNEASNSLIQPHFLQLFLDHDDNINLENRDDVVHFQGVQLPPVLSPTKCRLSVAPCDRE